MTRAYCLLVSAALMLSSSPLVAQKGRVKGPSEISFYDLTWRMDSADVTVSLGQAGFEVTSGTRAGDIAFAGNLGGHKARVVAYFASGALVRLFVVISESFSNTRDIFDEMRRYLVGKYGDPVQVESPAFLSGFRSEGADRLVWVVPDSSVNPSWDHCTVVNLNEHTHLILGMAPNVGVGVDYITPAWTIEKARRKAAKTATLRF